MGIRELPDDQWVLIHKLNGQLISTLKSLLVELINWRPEHWIVTALMLQRTIEEREEAVLKTSSTMLNGEIFSEKNANKGVGDLNRIVPLVKSFAGYCVRSGNVLWVDDIENHPLKEEYRPYEYVNIRPNRRFVAEYVFPIHLKTGVHRTILGVLNVETSNEGVNEFREAGVHRVSEIILPILDLHGPFLLLAQVGIADDSAAGNLLKAHYKILYSTAKDIQNSQNSLWDATWTKA